VLEAISINALEVAWSSPGQPARYRINRGDWHIPTDPGELKATLAKLTGVQESLDILSETPDILSGDPGQNGAPLKEERKKEEEGPSVFETHNPELITRLREKGVIQ
jgi:hypothetical protein